MGTTKKSDFELVNVTTKEEADVLYKNSALTIEGLSKDSITDLFDWIEKYTPLKKKVAYVIDGSVMNKIYGLTGDNAYPQTDCSIVCVNLNDIEVYSKIAIPRLHISGRWFDDVVNNNVSREKKKSSKSKKIER